MSQNEKVFEPSRDEAHGLLSGFEPGTRPLRAGYRIDPGFRALPTDVVFEKDVAVTMRDGVNSSWPTARSSDTR
ncbi:hypothetical protein [Actinomadura opuntiae]|uniref:hypothetical protein n=1 Tax=Actinomadura sp. OS1-43 TaxID=604315 RepID=UPI00255AB4A7|nr:hypothetical protein [Actinomadura sp. OS1-43]MDL4818605.1 hypothetical protein [Actinomadura sp. OS1-43]